MLSRTDLPQDDIGLVPAGLWLVALHDPISDGFAGHAFVSGISQTPLAGRTLMRLVSCMGVVGALRVEGEPFSVGDVSRLALPVIVAPVAPSAPVVAVPVLFSAPAPKLPTAPAAGPTTAAELDAMTETQLRVLAAKMGATDGRWGLSKLRNFVADELGIEYAS